MDGGASEITEEGSVADLGVDLQGWWNETVNTAVVWSFILFGCFLLNALLLLAFLIRPGLRTISNRFVMNLTVSNLLTCAVINGLLIMDSQPSVPETSSTSTSMTDVTTGSICAISEGVTGLVTTSSILSVFLIAIDQYFAVVDPLRYRSRIDKLKSGILIFFVWFVSMTFGVLAFFNPNPRSLWLSCMPTRHYNNTTTSSKSTQIPKTSITFSTLPYLDHETTTSNEIYTMEDSIPKSSLYVDRISYGFVYAILHGLFAYLLPFLGVCWIYVRIYSAAHRNSERTRRTGSRPILSSASFTYEDQYAPLKIQQSQSIHSSTDDFRRITKISSLSLIDETSETTLSPIVFTNRTPLHCSSSDVEASSNVVFTVGSQRVDVSSANSKIDNNHCDRISVVAALKAEFLVNNDTEERYNNYVRSKFLDQPDQRRKSSHDIIYEQTLAKERSGDSNSDDNENNSFSNVILLQVPNVSLGKEKNCYSVTLENTGEKNNINLNLKDFRVEVEEEEEDDDDEEEEEEETVNHSFPSIADNIDFGKANEKINITCKKVGKDVECTTTGLLAPIVTITPASNKSLHRVSSTKSTSSYINSLKHRISNGSLFKYREETRAARISALVIVMGLICWSPYVVLVLLKNISFDCFRHLSHHYDILALSFFILAAYISPVLFGYRSRRVKRELRKFFCFRRELYKNNKSLMAKKVLKRRHSNTPSHLEIDQKYNIFNCVYGRTRCPKEKVQFVQVPETALGVETCRSSFSSGASTQISSTSTEEC